MATETAATSPVSVTKDLPHIPFASRISSKSTMAVFTAVSAAINAEAASNVSRTPKA
jgi:hypothetical protein